MEVNARYPTVMMNSSGISRLDKGQRPVELRARREAEKHDRVISELKSAHLGWYSMVQAEPRMVADLLHDWEHVAGAVYGYSPEGFAMLAATSLRILYVSKKFVFSNVNEVAFESVTGVSLESVGPYCKVILHTKVGDYSIQTINRTSARRFVSYIELKILEHEQRKARTAV